jgi:hypothetical protein
MGRDDDRQVEGCRFLVREMQRPRLDAGELDAVNPMLWRAGSAAVPAGGRPEAEWLRVQVST